jgi:hypothetical protein
MIFHFNEIFTDFLTDIIARPSQNLDCGSMVVLEISSSPVFPDLKNRLGFGDSRHVAGELNLEGTPFAPPLQKKKKKDSGETVINE